MMKKSWTKWILAAVIALLLIVGVPIIINECYKTNSGYMTMWGAADVLSYYGAIIAASIGVIGVYFTVYMANRNYREDARNRILPYIAIDVINNIQPDPFLEGFGSEDYSSMGNAPIIEESINGKANNHLFFVIDGTSKIRASESFHENEAEKAKRTSVMWIRAAKDGKMYLRESACISMPFLVRNIGNGPAKKLRMAFSCQNRTPFFKTEIILEQNKSFYIHIFSEKGLDEIKGNYVFSVYYEDISGNIYEQLFPVEIVNENKKWYTRIDTNGEQRLIRRTS